MSRVKFGAIAGALATIASTALAPVANAQTPDWYRGVSATSPLGCTTPTFSEKTVPVTMGGGTTDTTEWYANFLCDVQPTEPAFISTPDNWMRHIDGSFEVASGSVDVNIFNSGDTARVVAKNTFTNLGPGGRANFGFTEQAVIQGRLGSGLSKVNVTIRWKPFECVEYAPKPVCNKYMAN